MNALERPPSSEASQAPANKCAEGSSEDHPVLPWHHLHEKSMTYCIYQQLVGEGEVVELGASSVLMERWRMTVGALKASRMRQGNGPDSADDEGVELVRIVDDLLGIHLRQPV